MKRMLLEINGIVQGVGFRPFIHKLVKENKLSGWVKNSSRGVQIEIEGEEESLHKFVFDIKDKKPKLSVIESIKTTVYDELVGYNGFEIVKSTQESERFTLISPDVCICDDCLKELLSKDDRRYRFPFINCTNCGPRFTIIKDIPYDRDKTTMKDFPMCTECSTEYKDIEDRRYHAQPDCCFNCGPRVFFWDNKGSEVDGDVFKAAGEYLKEGKIVAVKGLGGFHLACDAENKEAVFKLRKRKQRDEKPFAVMCRDIESVRELCFVSREEEKLLLDHKRPIVLLKKKGDILKGVSIDNNYLGVMLPYTPVHYLIFEECFKALVMTSANISDMPVIYKNEEAYRELGEIADGFLTNNRDIHVRCDDSLYRVFDGEEYPIRRSRGYAPFPIKVLKGLGQVIACGSEQKASFALTKGEYVFLSQHIGDMKNFETLNFYEETIEHYKNIFGIVPKKIVCDLHPDYMSTEYAKSISKSMGIPLYRVQHHHAHMTSCMADNNIDMNVIGIIWDGTGYGRDGSIWGGEFLTGDFKSFERLGTIEKIPLPGGDKAVKEIERIGDGILYSVLGKECLNIFGRKNIGMIAEMIDKGINTPYASSIGRLFDGAASIIGLKDRVSYEGQGAVILEGIASKTAGYYKYIIEDAELLTFDWRPMIFEMLQDVNDGLDNGIIAGKFMNTLIKGACDITNKIRLKTGINEVVLSGGVFQNMYILKGLKELLKEEGFSVYTHKRVSCNDEGIALGQAIIAGNGGE